MTWICRICNAEVENPQRIEVTRTVRSERWGEYPFCPKGHILHSWIIGYMQVSSVAASLARGFIWGFLWLFLVVMSDLELQREVHTRQYWVTMAMAVFLGVYSAIAFYWAWSWAEDKGPVRKLNPRAAGVGIAFLFWALVAGAAGIFGWLHLLHAWAERRFST